MTFNFFNVVHPVACTDCYNFVYMENTFKSANRTMKQEMVDLPTNNDLRRNILLALSALVFIGIVLAVGIIINSQMLSKEISTEVIEANPTIVSSPTSSIGENQISPTVAVQDIVSSNWTTFSNAYVSFRYPTDMTLIEREASEVVIQKWGPTQKTDTEFYDGISISFQPFEVPLTAEEYAKIQIEEVTRDGVGEISDPLKPIQVGAYSGVTFSVAGLGNYRTIVLKSPNDMIILITDSSNDPDQLGFSRVVDRILTTVVLK